MMLKGYGVGNNVPGLLSLSMQEALARGMATRINDVSPTVKLVLMLGEYMHRHYHGRYIPRRRIYGCCCTAPMTTRCKSRRAGDATIPFTATPIPPPDAPLNTVIDVALNMQANTCSFDVPDILPSPCHAAASMVCRSA